MNLFRAFIAGTVFPTIFLPVILIIAMYNGKSQLLEVPVVHFIPIIWGIWNLLYFLICKEFLPGGVIGKYILTGGSLGLILALYGVFVVDVPDLLGFGEYLYYPLIFVPIGYAIVWVIVVKPLNNFLGVKE
jgi:hypothetical protein